jgi:hypothetical protein
MQTLDISQLRQERERLAKRIQQIDVLLDAVAAFDGSGPKKAGRPRGKGRMSAAGRAAIVKAQRLRWQRFKEQKKKS